MKYLVPVINARLYIFDLAGGTKVTITMHISDIASISDIDKVSFSFKHKCMSRVMIFCQFGISLFKFIFVSKVLINNVGEI